MWCTYLSADNRQAVQDPLVRTRQLQSQKGVDILWGSELRWIFQTPQDAQLVQIPQFVAELTPADDAVDVEVDITSGNLIFA